MTKKGRAEKREVTAAFIFIVVASFVFWIHYYRVTSCLEMLPEASVAYCVLH